MALKGLCAGVAEEIDQEIRHITGIHRNSFKKITSVSLFFTAVQTLVCNRMNETAGAGRGVRQYWLLGAHERPVDLPLHQQQHR